jgi:ParB family transcriptional regulator, chromosome partitioning protein
MSMTESKAPTKGKTTRPAKSTTKKNALTEKIEAALAKAVRKTATLGQLVLTDLNGHCCKVRDEVAFYLI